MPEVNNQQDNKTQRVYFRGLHALRFFAATGVIVTHIELIKKYFGLPNKWSLLKGDEHLRLLDILEGHYSFGQLIITRLGSMAVTFFFVLSGFLITYLLFIEKERTGKVAVKKFYLRRILRIWPLYFFILVLGFFVLPQISLFDVPQQTAALKENFVSNLIPYLLIFPNLAHAIHEFDVANIGQSWSIGVEEQFYIIWPLIIGFATRYKKTILIFIFTLLALKIATVFALRLDINWLYPWKKFLATIKMESMAIGGLGALWLFRKPKAVHRLFGHSALPFIAIAGLLITICLLPKQLEDGIFLVESTFFLMIIVSISICTSKDSWMESTFFRVMGDISYGIYMYHFMIVTLVVSFCKRYIFIEQTSYQESFLWQNMLLYIAILVLSIGVSFLSYRYFERFFISLKERFSIVKSGAK